MPDPMAPLRPLIAGNWKMNGNQAALAWLRDPGVNSLALALDTVLCLPATLIADAVRLTAGSALKIGAQDCHWAASGPYTGDISAEMLADLGAKAVILGHSERRAGHGETDALVAAKVKAAHAAGLFAIVCVGETAGERRAGLTEEVVLRQAARSLPDSVLPDNTALAYEPVWAIGSGVTPTPGEAAAVNEALRQALAARFGPSGGRIRLLYGGSVKPENTAGFARTAGIGGVLAGGASLQAKDFQAILAAWQERART